MNLFPVKYYNSRSSSTILELKKRLELLTKENKYVGYWKDNILYYRRNVLSQHVIIPEIKLRLNEFEEYREIDVEFNHRKRFRVGIIIPFVILVLVESLILYTLIRDKQFNFVVFAPVILGIFIYYIYIFSYKYEVIKEMQNLKKIIKNNA